MVSQLKFKNLSEIKEEAKIEITIKSLIGNKVKYDYYNDGSRGLLKKPYRPKCKHAKFRLPSGKAKYEVFGWDDTDEEILKAVSKKYSNLKFKLRTEIEKL